MIFNRPKEIKYKILTDTSSDLYKFCEQEIERGKSISPIWNKVRIDDWYIDKCFDDINNRLHRVPGAVNNGTGNLDGPYAHSSLTMTHENIEVNLRKDFSDEFRTEPTLFIEYIPKFKGKRQPLPLYLTDIINDYKATPVSLKLV